MSHYEELCNFIRKDVAPTLKNIKVISYSVVSMIVIGAAGIWVPWLWHGNQIALLPGSTVFTYVLALLGSLVCNKLFFHSNKHKEFFNRRSYESEAAAELSRLEYITFFERSSILSAWGILAGSVVIVMTAIVYSQSNNEDSILGVLSLVFAWILYYLATVTEVQEKTGGKGSQAASPIIPSMAEDDINFNADFFQNGEG